MRRILHKLYIFLLCLLHIFLGINGLVGGILLVIKTDGTLLGMQSNWLDHSPFKNYLVPGVLLFLFLGIIPLITSYGLIRKVSSGLLNSLNMYRNRHWAWSFSLYTGITAIFWITFQLVLTQYFWIQPVIIFTGLFIIILTMIPEVMQHFELGNNQ